MGKVEDQVMEEHVLMLDTAQAQKYTDFVIYANAQHYFLATCG